MIKPARQRITGQNPGTSHISAGAVVRRRSKARAAPGCYTVLLLIDKQGHDYMEGEVRVKQEARTE